MPITLQFVADDSVFDQAIKWFSHGWCTHVDSVWVDPADGQEKLIGARTNGGGLIRPLNYNKFKQVERVTLDVLPEQAADYSAFLLAQVGKPYDETAILSFAFDRDWRAEGHWFCSELAAAGLEKVAFFSHKLASPANRITPPDLWLALSVVTSLPEVLNVR